MLNATKEAGAKTQEKEIYKWAFQSLKGAIEPYIPKEFVEFHNLQIKLSDGNKIKVNSYGENRIEITVGDSRKSSLSFVVWDRGIESIGSSDPHLVMGNQEVGIEKFGVGSQGSLMSLRMKEGQEEGFDLIGLALTQWMTHSIQAGKLLPVPEVSIKLLASPQSKKGDIELAKTANGGTE